MNSTAAQRKEIGFLRSLMRLNTDCYIDMLSENYGVTTSHDLSQKDAENFIKYLRGLAIKQGVYKPRSSYKFQHCKYNNLEGRPGMASPKQLRMIEAMWKEVSRGKNDAEREQGLNAFLLRIVDKQRMQFLAFPDVQKVVLAIKKMKEQKYGSKNR